MTGEGAKKGNGENLNNSQAEPSQAITSADDFVPPCPLQHPK